MVGLSDLGRLEQSTCSKDQVADLAQKVLVLVQLDGNHFNL